MGLRKLSLMKKNTRSIIAALISLLFAVNSVYAMEMKVDFKLGQKGQVEQPIKQKKTCHGDSHSSSSTLINDYSYDCCGVDCHSCVSVTLFQSTWLASTHAVPDHFESMDIPSSPLDAFASDLYRPPIFS